MNKGRKGRKGAQKSFLSILYMCVNDICAYLFIYLLIYEITYIFKHCAPFIIKLNGINGLNKGRNVFIAPLIAPLFELLRPFC